VSRGTAAKATSLADDRALGLFFFNPKEEVVARGAGVDVEGGGGLSEAGLFGWGFAPLLHLLNPLQSPLFAPFA
jgi:hypothetical protein